MWLFVFFDLPVTTKKERKAATDFRKHIMKDGFVMMQFSVYTRHCASDESAQVHIKRVKGFLPEKGQVSILKVTDKQYSDITSFLGYKEKPKQTLPTQIELF
jgi:CRISPR-associated protein Cas2